MPSSEASAAGSVAMPDVSVPATATPAPEKLSVLETLKLLGGASRGSWLVNLVNFADGVAYFGMLALMTLFMEINVGFSTRASTISISLFTGGVTIFMALGGGTLSDKLGVRRALTLSLVLTLAGRAILTMAPGLGGQVGVVAVAALVIMAFGEGTIQPALYSGIKEYTDPRAATMGFAVLYAIMNVGIFVGELLSPKVREIYARDVEGLAVSEHPAAGIAGAFWFFIGFTAIVLVLHLVLFTRKVEERDRVLKAEPQAKKEGTLWERLRALPIMDGRFLFFIFILFPVRTLFAHQWLTMPAYVTRAFPPEVGARWEWVNGLNPLIIIFFVPLFAALTRHRRVVDMMIVGTVVSAVASFLLVFEPNLALLLTYVVVWSLGEALWSSRFLEYVADLAPPGKIGVYMGLATIPWFMAKSVTGFYAGTMLDIFVPRSGPQDPGTMWLIYGLTALVSPIGLVLARRWLLAKEMAAAKA